MRKRITLEDVAKRAGVSTATVSRVINGSAGVREDVVTLVEEVIRDLEYQPPGKKANDNTQNSVGLVVPYIDNPYISNIVSIVENILEGLGYKTIVIDSRNINIKSVESAFYLQSLGVKGIIYIPTHKKNREELRLHDLNVPVVYIGRKIDGEKVDFVGTETYNAAYNGCRYLISLGHRDILYVTGDSDATEGSVDFLGITGYKQALLDSGMKVRDDYIISGDYEMKKTEEAVSEYLGEYKPSAVFCSGDVMAFGVINCLTKLKLKIPEDVSVLGFDDLPISSVVGLTTIAQNTYSIGQNACLMLDDKIKGRDRKTQELLFPTNIVFRNTCALLN